MPLQNIAIYDTTLRDGEQGADMSFSIEDKIQIAQMLDNARGPLHRGRLAPGLIPRRCNFLNEMRNFKLRNAKLAAFGSTRRKKIKAADDSNLKAMIDLKVPVCTIFGKSWDLHVREALRTTLEENLAMIADSVSFLKKKKRESHLRRRTFL